jgi:hypothetical protein
MKVIGRHMTDCRLRDESRTRVCSQGSIAIMVKMASKGGRTLPGSSIMSTIIQVVEVQQTAKASR